jgi:hypothetical protein
MIDQRAAALFPVFFAVLLITGCAAAPKKDYSRFRAADPHSILVVPVLNNTVAVEAPALYLTTLPIPLAERGYYVFPVNMVKGVLEDEGIAEQGLLHGAGPARLCALFGADAVLYVTIEAWTATYMLFNTQVTVEFDYVMKDGKTGETIWTKHERIFEDSSQGARDPVSPFIMAIIAKAYPNYAGLARSANAHAFWWPGMGLPPGPYHSLYGKDPAYGN